MGNEQNFSNTAVGLKVLRPARPADLDAVLIVISHGPPYGVLDVEFRSGGVHRGCPELMAAIQRVKPAVAIFGHVHASRGATRIGETTFINAAMLGWSGDLENRPVAFDFPLKGGSSHADEEQQGRDSR